MDEEDVQRMALIGHALSDPGRLKILLNFRGRAMSISDITEEMGSYQSSVSYHISILLKAGLISRTDNGRWHFYQVEEDAMDLVKSFLAESTGKGRKRKKSDPSEKDRGRRPPAGWPGGAGDRAPTIPQNLETHRDADITATGEPQAVRTVGGGHDATDPGRCATDSFREYIWNANERKQTKRNVF